MFGRRFLHMYEPILRICIAYTVMAKVAVKYITLVTKAIHAGNTKSSEARRDLQPNTLIPPLFICWLLSGT